MVPIPWSLSALVLLVAVASPGDAASGEVKIIHSNGYAAVACTASEAAAPECAVSSEGEPAAPSEVQVTVESPVADVEVKVKPIRLD